MEIKSNTVFQFKLNFIFAAVKDVLDFLVYRKNTAIKVTGVNMLVKILRARLSSKVFGSPPWELTIDIAIKVANKAIA